MAVLGDGGFLGGWLQAALNQLGARLVWLRDESGRIDINDVDRLSAALSSTGATVVINAAGVADAGIARGDPLQAFRVNTLGAAAVLEAAERAATVNCLVHVATRNSDPRGVVSTGGSFPPDTYHLSKLMGELALDNHLLSTGWAGTVAVVRPGVLIGGGDRTTSRLLPSILQHVRSGTMVSMAQPGAVRYWEHVVEAAFRCLEAAVPSLQPSPGVEPVASFAVRDITARFLAEIGRSDLDPHQHQPAPDLDSSFGDASCTLTVGEAVARTARWIRADGSIRGREDTLRRTDVDSYVTRRYSAPAAGATR